LLKYLSLLNAELNEDNQHPFDNNTTLEYYTSERSEVSLSIIDMLARTIKELSFGLTNGLQTYTWKGDDRNGRQVMNGVYYFLLEVNGDVSAVKAVVMHTK